MKRHRPEQPTGRNNGSVVVDLLRCDCRSNRTGEDIQSYEPEDTLVQFTVFRDELTFHETHVRLKRQRVHKSRTSSGAANPVQTHEALEVRNLRGFIERRQWSCGRLRWKMVDEYT